MPSAILWDNDGVLVDTEVLYFQANRTFFAGHGIELTEDQYYRWFLCCDSGAWHLLRERGWHEERIAEGRRQRNAVYRDLLAASGDLARPGMRRLVQSLHGRARMAVVTSSNQDHFEIIHQGTGLTKYFEFVVSAGQYAKAKPDPEPYLVALSRLGVAPQDCVAVEDSPRGFQAARAAGLSCIVIRTPLARAHDFSGAAAVVESAEELAATLGA